VRARLKHKEWKSLILRIYGGIQEILTEMKIPASGFITISLSAFCPVHSHRWFEDTDCMHTYKQEISELINLFKSLDREVIVACVAAEQRGYQHNHT